VLYSVIEETQTIGSTNHSDELTYEPGSVVEDKLKPLVRIPHSLKICGGLVAIEWHFRDNRG